jgi:hypothetical protein
MLLNFFFISINLVKDVIVLGDDFERINEFIAKIN